MGDFDYTVSEHLATAWAEKYQNLTAKIKLAERFPNFYRPEAVLDWKHQATEALQNYQFWVTEV